MCIRRLSGSVFRPWLVANCVKSKSGCYLIACNVAHLIEGLALENHLRIKVSRHVSYLLRHNPEDLEMDNEGFVELDQLLSKLRRRFPTIDRKSLMEMVEQSERKRFEIEDNRIRALYGHTIDVHVNLKEDTQIERLYHGTTTEAAEQILEKGLQPMKRIWVHLSPTKEIAYEVGKRRADSPLILMIDVTQARSHGLQFFKATDKVYMCKHVPAKYIKKLPN